MTHYTKSLTGILTVGVFGTAATLAWPSHPIAGGLLGVMAAYRLFMVYREWPRT